MLQVILERDKNRLPIGEHDGMAWLSCLLLETSGRPGIAVTHSLGRVRGPAGNDTRALSVDISGSLGALREVQGSKGDLFPHSTLARRSQTTHHLLHLEVD